MHKRGEALAASRNEGKIYNSGNHGGGGVKYRYRTAGNTVIREEVAVKPKKKPAKARAAEVRVQKKAKPSILDAPVNNSGMRAPKNVGLVFFSFFILGIVCISCIKYVDLRNECTSLQKKISRDKIVYNDLKLANDEEYDRIMGSVNLEDIKKTAMDELGMDYPKKSQVVVIPGNGSDYVRQYKKIPDKQPGDELEKSSGSK